MDKIEKLEEDIENLRKQIWMDNKDMFSKMDNINKIYPTLQNAATQLESINNQVTQLQNSVENLSEVGTKVDILQTSVNELTQVTSTLPELQTTVNNIKENSLPELDGKIQETITGLSQVTAKIPEIQSTITNITETIIPELESKIENSGGGGGGSGTSKQWITLYDMNSADENINLGHPTGIFSSAGVISNFPDITPYRKFRLTINKDIFYAVYYFEVIGTTRNAYNFYYNTAFGTEPMNAFLYIEVNSSTNKLEIDWGRMITMDIGQNRYPKVKNHDGDTAYKYSKLEALVE